MRANGKDWWNINKMPLVYLRNNQLALEIKMTQIKFGTDGWRAIIARDFTEFNVMRVAEATAKWILNKGDKEALSEC